MLHSCVCNYRAESRKEALAKAAEEMRESGKTASAFSDSQYAVSEDKSPNVHTRQVKLMFSGTKLRSNLSSLLQHGKVTRLNQIHFCHAGRGRS